MTASPARGPRSAAMLAIGAILLGVGLWPHAARWSHPSVYGDDVGRIWCLETLSTSRVLMTPFNEHIAPFFDSVTALCWVVAGRRLTGIASAFTTAAFVPFGLALALLARLARRDLGSWPPAAVTVAAFAIAPIHVVETAWWYSGSNHMWAASWTLAALLGAGRGGAAGLTLVLAGSALAPACSAMGIVAAPACILYVMAGRGRRWPAMAAAAAGAIAYLVAAIALGLIPAIIKGRTQASDPAVGLIGAFRAPSTVLLPALFNVRDVALAVPTAWGVGLTIALTLAAAVLAWRGAARGLTVVGVWLVLAAYLLIYPFRSLGGAEAMFRVARYHMYPQLGLSLILGAVARPLLGGRRGGLYAVTIVAGLLALHTRRMVDESALYDFPNQRLTLAALEHVRAICRHEGISGAQAVAALEPIRPHWMSLDVSYANAVRLIGSTPGTGRVADPEARRRILAALTAADREGLFGGMDVGPYLRPASSLDEAARPKIVAAQAGSLGMTPASGPGPYQSRGWPSSLEYRWEGPPSEVAQSRWLAIDVDAPEGGVELWWSDDSGTWSEGRSVAWNVDPRLPPSRLWAVPLDRMPHWDGRSARRVRVMFRFAGRVAIMPPVLLP